MLGRSFSRTTQLLPCEPRDCIQCEIAIIHGWVINVEKRGRLAKHDDSAVTSLKRECLVSSCCRSRHPVRPNIIDR